MPLAKHLVYNALGVAIGLDGESGFKMRKCFIFPARHSQEAQPQQEMRGE